MKTSVIEVHDMLSVWSVEEVEKRIGQVPGVESVTVNYAAKSATVRYDETRLEVTDIKSAVRQSGYESPGESPPTPKAGSASSSTPATTASAGDTPQDKATPDASPSTPVDAAPKPSPAKPAATPAPTTAAPKPAAAAAPAPAAPAGDGKKDKAAPSTPAAAAPKPLPDAPVAAPGATPAAPAAGGHKDHHAHMAADFQKRFWISLVLTLPILVLSPMLQKLVGLREAIRFPGDLYVLFGLGSAVFWYGGWPFLKGFFEELKSRRPGMMTLISVAVATAYIYSSAVVFGLAGKMFFWELATLVDIMLLGHWIEMKSVMGASRALEELAKLMPSDAHKLMPDGSVKDVPLGELAVNDKVLIKPGEKIPADGVIVAGESSVNEAMLTGESTPAAKKTGAKVIGGAINGEGSLTIEVNGTGKDSFLSQVIDLVKQAQESKSKTQDLANTAALWLTIVALGGGVTTLVVWLSFIGKDFAFAIERAVTVMVIACPHALGLAVPLVVAVSTALAAKNGLLIRNRVAFEGARKLQAIIFDKTGTLTEGRFGVTETLVLSPDINEETLRSYAASVDANSEHPIAKAIAAASEKKLPVENFKSITGKGAEGRVEGKDIKVVNPGYLRDQNIALADPRVEPLQAQGKTVVFVLVDGQLKGAIALADIVRPEAKQAIAALKALNIQCLMLTGDNKATAKWVSDQVGLDEYFAEVLPQDKAAKVKEVQSRGKLVAMTGDGVNDAPALAQANVGIAIGAGSDVAVETADVILVRSNPLDVVAIVQLSRATYRKMIQNLIWATGYNVVAIPLAAGALYAWGVLLTPALGAVFMSASTVIVAINARLLRLKRGQGAKKREQKFPADTKQRENRDQQTVTPLTEKEA
jgi:Cu2+-exporting ATPase